jgi:hypothetical protein
MFTPGQTANLLSKIEKSESFDDLEKSFTTEKVDPPSKKEIAETAADVSKIKDNFDKLPDDKKEKAREQMKKMNVPSTVTDVIDSSQFDAEAYMMGVGVINDWVSSKTESIGSWWDEQWKIDEENRAKERERAGVPEPTGYRSSEEEDDKFMREPSSSMDEAEKGLSARDTQEEEDGSFLASVDGAQWGAAIGSALWG